MALGAHLMLELQFEVKLVGLAFFILVKHVFKTFASVLPGGSPQFRTSPLVNFKLDLLPNSWMKASNNLP